MSWMVEIEVSNFSLGDKKYIPELPTILTGCHVGLKFPKY